MLPLTLPHPVAVIFPFPSNVIALTPANGIGAAFEAVKNPTSLSANVPLKLATEHPLSAAFAAGATLRASAVSAANGKRLCDGAVFHDGLLFV